jgi:hypothetical protein
VIPDWERDTAHIIVEFDLRTPCSSHEAFLREAGDLGEMMYDELRSSPAGQRGNISVSEFQTFDGRRIDSSRELIVERLTFVYGYEDLMACSCTEMDGLTGAGFSGPRGVYKYRQIWWMTMQHTFPPGPIYYKLALYVYETAPEWMPPLPEPVPTAIPMFGRDSPTDPLPSWVNAPPVGEQTLSPTPTPPREPTLEVTAEPAPELTLELTAEPTSPWLSPLPTLERDAPPRPTPTPARPHELRTEPTIGETPIPVEAPEMTVAVTPVGTPEVTHEVFLEADIGASSGMTVEEPTPAEGENETV